MHSGVGSLRLLPAAFADGFAHPARTNEFPTKTMKISVLGAAGESGIAGTQIVSKSPQHRYTALFSPTVTTPFVA
jgi:hypothetical protein